MMTLNEYVTLHMSAEEAIQFRKIKTTVWKSEAAIARGTMSQCKQSFGILRAVIGQTSKENIYFARLLELKHALGKKIWGSSYVVQS
jgi:hypothetical protein